MDEYFEKPQGYTTEADAALSFLNKSVSALPGIGDKFFNALQKIGIATIKDLIYSFPYRFEVLKTSDFSEKGVLIGAYERSGVINTRNGKRLLKVVFRSENGYFSAIWLHFTSDYPLNILKKNKIYYLYGNISRNDGIPSIFHPEFIDKADVGSVRPMYSVPGSVPLKIYKKTVEEALKQGLEYILETLPDSLLNKYKFPGIKDTITTLHKPETEANVSEIMARTHSAYKRFIYEEFFYLQIAMEIKRRSYATIKGIEFKINKDFLNKIKKIMPFRLTQAQRRTLVEIFNDMMLPNQMNRLVQGDVGSGKTIVAFIAGAAAVENGYQVIIIAPTEVLAEQHYRNLQNFFKNSPQYSICLLTGSVNKKNKTEAKQFIASGNVNFVVGTHAILEENVEFSNLGLVIVDEQHRFGVRQRKTLMNKGVAPDVILMTATPIPRTLAMTVYGDLDVSIIDKMPPGRIPCITKCFPADKLNDALKFIDEMLSAGQRAYFIYPLIDESDKLELKAATKSFDYVKKFFNNKKVALLHGKMKGDEKNLLLNEFKNGVIDVLVSTTVVEVGVDVPEATVILIENAERFGLSQLHQLRGRVGRSNLQSYCLLITSQDITEDGRRRIDAMLKYTDGFKLAEIDLEIRGHGDFFGTKQSGLPEFKFASIITDTKILQAAQKDAREILSCDSNLEKQENKVIKDTLCAHYYGGASYLGVG